MITQFKFYKEESNRWFINLPDWKGEKDDLEMVLGADTLLDILANGNTEVEVIFGDEPFEECHTLTHDPDVYLQDGFYTNDAWHGPSIIWLCYVTEFVFGSYPEKIYYKLA